MNLILGNKIVQEFTFRFERGKIVWNYEMFLLGSDGCI